MNEEFDHPVELPIDGILDLHTFNPKDVPSLLEEYISLCHGQGIVELRIIHGKGKGFLRAKVHSILGKHPLVASFSTDSGPSGWGATLVHLKKS